MKYLILLNYGRLESSLVGLALTGLFLVMDLDRPDRFLNVLLRPQWKSWLVKGGYTISIFGLLVTVWGANTWFDLGIPETPSSMGNCCFCSVIGSLYSILVCAGKRPRFLAKSNLAFAYVSA